MSSALASLARSLSVSSHEGASAPASAGPRLVRARVCDSTRHSFVEMMDCATPNKRFRVFRFGMGLGFVASTLAYYFEGGVDPPRLIDARCLGVEPLTEQEIAKFVTVPTRHEREIAANLDEYLEKWRAFGFDDRVFCLSLDEARRADAVWNWTSRSAETELWRWAASARRDLTDFPSTFTEAEVSAALESLLARGVLVFDGAALSTPMRFPPVFLPAALPPPPPPPPAPAPALARARFNPADPFAEGLFSSKGYTHLVLVATRASVSASFWNDFRFVEDAVFFYDARTLRRAKTGIKVARGAPFTYEELTRLGVAAEKQVDYVVVIATPDVGEEHAALANSIARLRGILVLPLEKYSAAAHKVGIDPILAEMF